MKQPWKTLLLILISLVSAAAATALVRVAIPNPVDKWTQDTLYQHPTAVGDRTIVIIGIDDKTLSDEELGPFGSNYRDYMIYALEELAKDPERLPAVVGLDITYGGSIDPYTDADLADAARNLGNVVTAVEAEFDERTGKVTGLVEPYKALKDATVQGHINVMLDKDGILRHAIYAITKPDGEQMESMAVRIAALYLEQRGKTLRQPPLLGNGHYYVPFYGRPGDLSDDLSFCDLVSGRLDPSVWDGKIVLIGPYANGLGDAYTTSIARAIKMQGVEYHANVIQFLLDGSGKTEVPDWIQLLVIFAVCALAAFIFLKLKVGLGSAACGVLSILGVAAAFLCYRNGFVVHVLWLPVALHLLYLGTMAWHYIQAARERRALALEKERIATELALATRIQANYLPKVFPDRPEFDLYATMTPAKEVGGDLYDFFLIDDDHLCMVIGDVSGKGVPASLFMMLASALIHHDARHEISPAKVLTEVNAEICGRNPEEMFVTVWMGVLELSTGVLTAASAGHEYPAMKTPNGSFELVKDRHGFVIGGMDGVRYREYTLQLDPGARFFVYTDGVPEATDSGNEMFGTDRMIEALRSAENEDPKTIIDTVKDAVKAFVGTAPQFDDLTVLCIAYHGSPQNAPDPGRNGEDNGSDGANE